VRRQALSAAESVVAADRWDLRCAAWIWVRAWALSACCC